MVHTVANGLLESFRKLQQERNVLNTDKGNRAEEKTTQTDNRAKVLEKNMTAVRKMSVLQSVDSFEEAKSILNSLHHDLTHPRIIRNYMFYSNPGQKSLAVSS